MKVYSIPVMVDVEAESRHEAARTVADVLVRADIVGRCGYEGPAEVESWWLLDARDKFADRNDYASGRIVWSPEQ